MFQLLHFPSEVHETLVFHVTFCMWLATYPQKAVWMRILKSRKCAKIEELWFELCSKCLFIPVQGFKQSQLEHDSIHKYTQSLPFQHSWPNSFNSAARKRRTGEHLAWSGRQGESRSGFGSPKIRMRLSTSGYFKGSSTNLPPTSTNWEASKIYAWNSISSTSNFLNFHVWDVLNRPTCYDHLSYPKQTILLFAWI